MPHARKRRPSSLDMVMLDFMNQWTPAPVWMASDAALRIALYLSAEAILIARTVPHPVTKRAISLATSHVVITANGLAKFLGYSRNVVVGAIRQLAELEFITETDQRFVYRVNHSVPDSVTEGGLYPVLSITGAAD